MSYAKYHVSYIMKNILTVIYISFFSHCCDQNTWQVTAHGREGVLFWYVVPRDDSHHGSEGMATGTGAS